MSRPHASFVRARLGVWQRRIQETADFLVLAQAGTPMTGLLPVLDQPVAVHNLTSGLVSDLRQSTESSLADTDAGGQYLSHLAAALAHGSRAATHLSTAVFGLAGAQRPRPARAVPCRWRVTLGHAAALRSLHRALEAVASPLAEPETGPGPSPIPAVAEQHCRTADAASAHPTRRRP